MPMPPSCARAIARRASVTVSIAAETSGRLRRMWREKGGHVQYSDLPPPPGTPDGDILARPSASSRRSTPTSVAPPTFSASAATAQASAPRSGDPELEAKRKKAEAEVAAKNKAEQDRYAAAKADNCSRARAQLTTLKSG